MNKMFADISNEELGSLSIDITKFFSYSDTNMNTEIFHISCMTACMSQQLVCLNRENNNFQLFATFYFFKTASEIIFNCIIHTHIESP